MSIDTVSLLSYVVVLLVTYSAILAITRLISHPLSHIPGPKLAAATFWYEVYYDIALPGQYIFHIQELHKQYGPVVRVSPEEVHVSDLQYLDYIYAGSSQHRDKPLGGTRLDILDSLAGTTDFHLHKQRRKAMGSFFSKQAVNSLEYRIQEKINKMCQVMERHATNGTVVNLADLLYGLAWDVVFEYSFGAPSDFVTDEASCATLRYNLRTLLLGVKVGQYFPWLMLLSSLPFVGKSFIPPGAYQMGRLSGQVREIVESVLEDEDDKHRSDNRSIFYDIRDDPDLPKGEKAPLRLTREGTFLMLAGTESTGTSMKIALFHILYNPSVLAKVMSELDSLPAQTTLSSVEQLPYLTACVHEANRLSFGITVRNARSSPTEMQFGKIILPPRTLVSTSSLSVSGNREIFPDPFAFVPERWLGAQATKSKKYEFAFGRGARKCIGINLAHAEMYLSLATLLRRFSFELHETDVTDVEFKHDYQVAHPKLDSKGVRAKVQKRG